MAKIRKPSVKVVLLKHKTLANGEHPVALRVTFNRKSKYYVLKNDVGKTITSPFHKWNEEFGRFNRNKDTNKLLNSYEERADDVLEALSETDFTFSAFNNKYFKKYTQANVSAFFDALIDKLESENRYGSAKTYKDTKNQLDKYSPGITFQDIDFKFLEDFEKHLKGKGNALTSISIWLRTLRAVYNKAIAEDLISESHYPFKKFKIKSGNPVKRALTKESMVSLMKYEAKKESRKWHSLNYFVFSYLCRGMNMKDMALLTWKENVMADKIVYVRAKTANTKKTPDPTIIKIEPEIATILGHYSGNEHYVFPILEPGLEEITKRHRIESQLKKLNKDIKSIAREIGIPEAEHITMYWARHTYATTLKRAGIPTAIISESLGHASEATTKAYLDKFEQPEIDKTYQHLL